MLLIISLLFYVIQYFFISVKCHKSVYLTMTVVCCCCVAAVLLQCCCCCAATTLLCCCCCVAVRSVGCYVVAALDKGLFVHRVSLIDAVGAGLLQMAHVSV